MFAHFYFMPRILQEKWVRMPFCNYKYAVSNFGRIKSIYSITATGKINLKETILKFTINSRGYYIVGLSWNSKGIKEEKTCKVHRLVALHHIKNQHNKPEVNHKDLNKLNNHISNLEWVTPRENTSHAQINGARPIAKPYLYKGYRKDGNPKPIIDINTGIFYSSKELARLRNTTPKEICRMLAEERKPNTTQYRYA